MFPAFYIPTGAGTTVQEGTMSVKYNRDGSVAKYATKKNSEMFNGKKDILEESITADYALIKAYTEYKGDKIGR